MKYDWITIALQNGGLMQVYYLKKYGYLAEMEWPDVDSVFSDYATNLPDALTSLNTALEDDAGEEVCS